MELSVLAERVVELRLSELGFFTFNLNHSVRNHPGSDLLILTALGERLVQVKSSSKEGEVDFGRGSEAKLREINPEPMYGVGPFRPHYVVCVYREQQGAELSALIFDAAFAEDLIVRAERRYHEPFPDGQDDVKKDTQWRIPLPHRVAHGQGRIGRLLPFAEEMMLQGRRIRGNAEAAGLPPPWNGRPD